MLQRIKYSAFKLFGHTSCGIELCIEHGASSAPVLEYIYQNQPHGKWGIGKLLDQLFLADPSSEAVRLRRQQLEAFLIEAIHTLREEQKQVNLIDLASGTAPYIFSILEQVGEHDFFACCRDIDEHWLQKGAREAKRRQLTAITFEKGDAFDANSLLCHKPRPNLIILSEFYPWISEDAKVKESMGLVYQILETDGYFVLTNQMAEVPFTETPPLTYRPKEKIQQWLEEEGFIVEMTYSDPNSYYSVIKARK